MNSNRLFPKGLTDGILCENFKRLEVLCLAF